MLLKHYYIQFLSAFNALILSDVVICTTEWFGDLRAHMNPPKLPPFHDIIYDESDCPFGLESVAIPEFVYFGEMIATKFVREHSQCLQFCLKMNKCKAVNFFEGMEKKDPEIGFCELLVEGQYDNPRLMRPFRRATYYEKIHCRVENEEEKQPFAFDVNEGKGLLIDNENSTKQTDGSENGKEGNLKTPTTTTTQQNGRRTNDQQSPLREDDDRGPTGKNGKAQSQDDRKEGVKMGTVLTDKNSAPVAETTNGLRPPASLNALMLKRLAERIRELKERFRN
ncbi:hypothetical protein GPALN_010979 [Globodera pallida]|nr:hypothetical protein GPALN_010979 [Globodera pallida]